MLIPQFSRKHESNDGKLECPGQKRKNDKVCTELSRLFLVCLEEIKVFFFLSRANYFFQFFWLGARFFRCGDCLSVKSLQRRLGQMCI